MSQAQHHHRIDYIEMASADLTATKAFFTAAFGWRFTDYGPEYTAFEEGRLNGGFYGAETAPGRGALVVLYSKALKPTLDAVVAAGGSIAKPIFSFPGGRRFHFVEPGGNELAVWSE